MGISQTDLSSKLAFDAKGVSDLKSAAKQNSPDALKGAATQFEAMFINMMMKSMRDATPQDGMMDSQETRTFTSMLDQQLSQKLAKRGIGLADMMVKQLSTTQQAQALAIGEGSGAASAAASVTSAASNATAGVQIARTMAGPGQLEPVNASSGTSHSKVPHIRDFQNKLQSEAEEASRATGIPAKFMLGQAALESGWGRREIKNADGSPSHNLFGIKAGKGWTGKTVSAYTTEYINGRPQTRVEKFRAYDSYADAFKDYGNLLAKNPRYEKVLAHGGDAATFAHGLQKAGYATDPFYATKLTRIIQKHLVG
ncbi:flagellar assembly peptidoglycan hydrolase FlgJ [Massilia arenosa]|uniref:Peptidoglycan hydrolase FlgJ n=1 Tax=Zemynaea arenosa TaxID=2561931 RepID=A0A4Y9ST97_9BURK|nr:flagellar assembly peptidoglycan hydrolase FlgJ [Massilia arenosa]TFW29910.1 flagellar assembly peptidoglycan hydrolase FlgJ [Massilia arenosa]